MSTLSIDEKSRYLRHILLDEIGEEGQLKLKRSSILCVGAGGLGSPALLYLAAAGVGRIGIIDPDQIDISNLQRQVLYTVDNVGKSKSKTAKEKLLALNPHIQIEIFEERFNASNAEHLLSQFDAIMDGTDNFSTRYLVNDVSIKLRKPNFFGSIFKFTGQLSVFGLDGGCYRCLFPHPPSADLAPDCARAGVLGALPGIVGTYQALEFIKWRTGIGELLMGKLLMIDTLKNQFRTLAFEKKINCICNNPLDLKLVDQDFTCAVPTSTSKIPEITVAELRKKLDEEHKFILIDVRDPVEYEIGNLGGLLIPLETLPKHLERLPKDSEVVVHCRSGGRSTKACEILIKSGYSKVFNVVGGILAWQREIDRNIKV